MIHTIRLIALIFVLAIVTAGQTVPEKNATEDQDKLQKDAVAFLRETLGDINGMRTLENRISFASEIAGLMWYHDEREARAMYNGLIGDFHDLIAKYDSQMNATADDGDGDALGYSILAEPTEKSRIARRFGIALGVRQQITMSMAEHDPDLAFGFYYDVISSVSNPELRRQFETQGTYFQFQLLNQLAESHPDKVAKYGARSLANGVDYQHIDLLRKVHAKDPERGVELGAAILARYKSDKVPNTRLYVLSSIIELGESTYEQSRKPGGKRAIYTMAEIRELVEILAQGVLSQNPNESDFGGSYVDLIGRHLPGRAAQIRAKFKVPSAGGFSNRQYAVANAMNAAANAAAAYGEAESEAANSNSNSAAAMRDERAMAQKKLYEDMQSLGNKPLPKEERDKIIAQARRIIMQTPGRDKKIAALSMLAGQVAKLGDKELASEIMRDAERLVNPAPRNYQDFMLTWILASGYAASDPEKAFPILEDVISRANDTLSAFVRVGEFIDVNEEMIQDGEVQVGVFGGQMIRGLTRELTMADATIQLLARSDFAKTKALTNRFDRPEIRVLAKMMVLRAILKPVKAVKQDETESMPVSEPEFR